MEDTVWGVTIDLALKYRKPVPYGCELTVVARVDEDLGRMFNGSGEIILPDGTVAVTATGRYLKQPAMKISGEGSEENELRFVEGEELPGTIEIPG